jgi:hypothetical protein
MKRACRIQPLQIATIIVDDGHTRSHTIIHLKEGSREEVRFLLAFELNPRERGGRWLHGRP